MLARRLRLPFRLGRALLRDWSLLLREFWWPLVGLGMVTVLVALVFQRFYGTVNVAPGTLPLDEAIYLVMTLTVLEGAYLPPSENHWLIVLYFVMPVVGVIFAGQGLLNFLTLLFNRQARGQAWRAALVSTLSGHQVVCGVGRVGSLVSQNLLASGADVVAIEQNLNQTTVQRVTDLGGIVLEGDARHYDILKQAGIPKAAAVIICTNNDLANLETALHCRELNPDIRVVLRMFDSELASKVRQTFNIEAAFSSSALAAPIFAGAALELEMQQSFYVGEDVLSVARLEVRKGSRLDGATVAQVERALDLSIITHERSGTKNLHPEPAIRLMAQDSILALGDLPTLHSLGGWNRAR